ncbi:MAG: ABC transporter, ATP-binding protein (cluster 5, nickel/peptides/opines) [Pseudolabrys sp.]|jgi:peptide/nickel transport system ATP-binding protein|nr:ABC transporter, ATP-binding protein (cluster 5, nickel/peptides/opines) [Pseudolabrys sp.]
MSETLLELRHVTRVFDLSQGVFRRVARLTAVADVSLTVKRGEVFALVGESGSGKTTLAKMLLGLLPPSSGEILVDGAPVTAKDRVAISRRVQPIFQDPYSSLNPRKSVAQLIALPLIVHGVGNRASRRAKVMEMLDLVGLSRRHYDAYPGQLSGGQRQRVAIARALILRPEVVICDEPTSALDVSVQAQILNLLLELKRELGLTYFFISHNLAVVEHLADRVAVMYLGRFVEERSRAGLFASPRHPYTRALLESVLTPDPDLGVPDTRIGNTTAGGESGCPFNPRCPDAIDICHTTPPAVRTLPDGWATCHLIAEEAVSAS